MDQDYCEYGNLACIHCQFTDTPSCIYLFYAISTPSLALKLNGASLVIKKIKFTDNYIFHNCIMVM